MEVLLREDVDKLGRRGDVVKVAEGYGRNFLLPRGLALAVNEANKAMIDKERKAHEARLAKEKVEFQGLADRIGTLRFVAPRKVGEDDVLYASVTSGASTAAPQATNTTDSTSGRRRFSNSPPSSQPGSRRLK